VLWNIVLAIGVVVVGMCGIQLAAELSEVPELGAVALSAVFEKLGL